MKIIVTTPTGRVGSQLARLLVQAGERPTLVARDPARLSPGLRQAAEVVELDLQDGAALVAATAGADALYWVAPPTGADDPVEGYARTGRNAARAVRENAVARVVFQSSGGAEARQGFGEIDGLARTEQLLDDTGASVTHLRCGYFFTNLLMDVDGIRAGVLTTTLPVDQPIPWVDPHDISAVAAGRLLSTAWTGRHTQGVHGPVDLSFREVAAIVSDAVGRPVAAEQVSDDAVAAQLRSLGMTEAQVNGVLGMSQGLRGDFTPENRRDLTTTTPTSLAAWAAENLRPAVH